MDNWSKLPLRKRAELISLYVDGGVIDLPSMRQHFNSFSEGGYTPSKSIKDYIKNTEAFRSKWYLDGNGVPTVGYGFTGEYFKKKYPNGMTKEADVTKMATLNSKNTALKESIRGVLMKYVTLLVGA